MTKAPSFEKFAHERGAEDTALGLALDRIMSLEEYDRRGEHAWPYTYTLTAGSSTLYYFGSQHPGNDPTHPEYALIEAAFAQANPEMVLVEGMRITGDTDAFESNIRSLSRDEVITTYATAGYVLWLALHKGIGWHSPEPDDADLYEHLLTLFQPDELFAWYVLHIIPQYHRDTHAGGGGFAAYVADFIQTFAAATQWKGFEYSLDHALDVAATIVGETIDVESTQGADAWTDPVPHESEERPRTVLNRISRIVIERRDRKIVRDIAAALGDYARLFVVYGGSHAVVEEPALRALLSDTR